MFIHQTGAYVFPTTVLLQHYRSIFVQINNTISCIALHVDEQGAIKYFHAVITDRSNSISTFVSRLRCDTALSIGLSNRSLFYPSLLLLLPGNHFHPAHPPLLFFLFAVKLCSRLSSCNGLIAHVTRPTSDLYCESGIISERHRTGIYWCFVRTFVDLVHSGQGKKSFTISL